MLRCFARIWDPIDGAVTFSCEKDNIFFLPQQPYLPIGTLREVLLNPDGVSCGRRTSTSACCTLWSMLDCRTSWHAWVG